MVGTSASPNRLRRWLGCECKMDQLQQFGDRQSGCNEVKDARRGFGTVESNMVALARVVIAQNLAKRR